MGVHVRFRELGLSRLVLAATIVGCLGLVAAPASAQLLGWSVDQRITSSTGQVYTPDLVVGNTGHVHIVWSDNRDGAREIYYCQLDTDGNVIVPDTRLSFHPGLARRPVVALDTDGFVHVVWEDNRDGNEEIYHSKLDAGGTILVPEQRMTFDAGRSKGPRMCFDSQRSMHMVWQDFREGNWLLMHREFNQGGIPTGAETRLTEPPFDAVEPDIAIDDSDNIHLVWSDNRVGFNQVVYAKLDDTLAVEGNPVTDGTNSSFSPRVHIDPLGAVHIVWRDFRDRNSEVYYQKQNLAGSVLANDVRLTVDWPASLDTAVLADHTGSAHIIWRDNAAGNLEIRYARLDRDALNIADARQLTFDPADSIEPSIALAPSTGKLHLVWRDFRDDGIQAEVYHKVLDPAIAARQGTVNLGNSPIPFDVVTVNGSIGDPVTRTIFLAPDTPGTVDVIPPPGKPQGARYCLYFYEHVGNGLDTRNPGYGVGDMVLSNIVADPTGIQPSTILNALRHYPLLGFPTQIPDRAPSTALRFPQGLIVPGEYSIQGFILDSGATNKILAVTNAVIVKVE